MLQFIVYNSCNNYKFITRNIIIKMFPLKLLKYEFTFYLIVILLNMFQLLLYIYGSPLRDYSG